jgi:hypothetical protein
VRTLRPVVAHDPRWRLHRLHVLMSRRWDMNEARA